MQFPERPLSHQLEEQAERHLRASLPDSWTVQRVQHDYGVDLLIDIFEQGRATGLELIIQLKAAGRASPGGDETLRLRVSTYNLLWNRLQVAMLVKYVAEEDEGYWLLLRDVPSPDQARKSLTVHIPRAQRLSTIHWEDVVAVVREVTDRKLAAQRAHMLMARGVDPQP
jgi:hypothetical protein